VISKYVHFIYNSMSEATPGVPLLNTGSPLTLYSFYKAPGFVTSLCESSHQNNF